MGDIARIANPDNLHKPIQLTIKDAERARLFEILESGQLDEDTDDLTLAPALGLSAVLWAILLGSPFAALFLLVLCFGGGW
jgi:hypothetical protein